MFSAVWRYLREKLGLSLLAKLISCSESNVERYAKGGRAAPLNVKRRLIFLYRLVRILERSFNEFGIKRWFERKRVQLGGRSPSEVLSGNWNPGDPEVEKVRELANRLSGPAGAT